ncbi:MAG TPA: hypothetical protein VNM43_11775 [Dehalococcoidia bacterium]|nr:hypothetical protein [Dehalococcoidia bacterium]
MRRLLLAVLLAATLAGCRDRDEVHWLYFYSNRAGNDDVYALRSDGTGLRRLTDHPARDYEPRVSPDGERIVFVSTRDGSTQLYIMNADGSNQRRLTFSGERDPRIVDDYAYWSPDGTKIVFQRSEPLPDGERMQADIWVIDLATGEEIRLTDEPSWDSTPSWTADGQYILFESNRADPEATELGETHVWRMRPDGSNPEQLIHSEARAIEPKPAPDGRIAFTMKVDDNEDLYIADADGGNIRRVTTDLARDRCPMWLSDDLIVFFSDRDGNNEIYVVRPDGSGLRRLTHDPGNDELC